MKTQYDPPPLPPRGRGWGRGLTYTFFLLLLPLELHAQQTYTVFDVEREVMADGSRGPYRIGDRPIVAQSERIRVGGRVTIRDEDYRIDYRAAEVTFEREVPRGTIIHAAYRCAPDLLKPVYRHRIPVATDSLSYPGDESPRYAPLTSPGDESPRYLASDSTDLTVGGSKTFGVGFGSDRDATLTQSLRLNLSGRLGGGVEVLGVLSDRNLPIQPDGSTRTLSELDQVLLRIRSPSLSAGLGDLDVSLTETEFSRYERRIQGVTGEVVLPSGSATVFGASTRGAYLTRQVAGIEGNQGPYVIGGSGGRILAGSERVFPDGERLTRGLSEDYVIDYDAGMIAFTPRRPISAESRIVVEAQGADGFYGRRIAGGRGRVRLWDSRVSVGATMIRESDVRDRPATTPLPATRPAPAEGEDSPRAAPTRHQVMGFDVAAEPLRGLSVNGEFAVSDLDRDLLSKEGDRLSRGIAFRTGLELRPVPVGLLGRGAGTFGLSAKARSVSGRFSPVGRTRGVEEHRRWGARPDLPAERSGEVEGVYRLTEASGVRLSYGRGRWGEDAGVRRSLSLFSAQPGLPRLTYDAEAVRQRSGGGGGLARHRAALEQTAFGLRPFFQFISERVEGSAARNLTGGGGTNDLSAAEYLEARPAGALSPPDWRYREVAGGLGAAQGGRVAWSSEWTRRRTARRAGGVWADSAAVSAQRLRLSVSRWRALSLDGDYTHRSRRTYGASPVVSSDHLTEGRLLYASRDGAVSQEMFYRLSSARLEQRRRTFVEVGRGRGGYTWADLNGDGRRDEEEYLADPDGDHTLYVERTGLGEPVRDATFSARLTVDLGRLKSVKREATSPSPQPRKKALGTPSLSQGEREGGRWVATSWERQVGWRGWVRSRDTRYEIRDTVFSSTSSAVKRLFSALSLETSLDADRRALRGERGGGTGVTPWALGRFAAGAGVASGRRSLQQDAYVFRYGRRLSVRTRYRRDDSISRDYSSGDLRRSTERSLRIRARLRPDLDAEMEALHRERSAAGSGPGYDLRSGEVQGRAHWRAGDLLATLTLSAGQDRDRLSATASRFFSVAPEVVRSFRGMGRLRAAGEWTRTSTPGDLPLYLALTQGRRPGDTLRWEVGADAQVGRAVTASCAYTGRRLPGLPVIHLGQAEVQASF